MQKYTLSLTAVLAASAAFAGTTEPKKPEATEQSCLDKLWSYPVLYRNKDNPVLEEFVLTGRFQLDYFNVDSNKPDTKTTKGNDDFTEVRRFRLGIDSWWADRHVQVKATVDTSLRSYSGTHTYATSVFYNRMTDLFVNFRLNDGLNFRVGKFEPHFGYDREFSDNDQKFFERGFFDEQVFNKTGNDYLSGVSLSGKIDNWGYQVAAFSDDVNKEFGLFHGGYSYLGEISYNFAKSMGADKALWAFDYLHMDNQPRANVFNTMNNAAATYFDYKKGRFCVVTQLGYGNGSSLGAASKGDIYSVMVMPSYLITDKLELITRYQYGTSSTPNGISTLNRQQKITGTSTGDTYNAGYVGLDYYVYGQKLKLMVGEEYAELTGGTGKGAGYKGWTTLVGFRLYW